MSLVLGDEVHDCVLTNLTEAGPKQHLLTKMQDGRGYEGRQVFEQSMAFKATTMHGKTQQRLLRSAQSKSKTMQRTKTTIVSQDPEKLKLQAIKEVSGLGCVYVCVSVCVRVRVRARARVRVW